MWSAGSSSCDAYIGTRGFAACRGNEVLATQAVDGLDAATDALRAWLGEQARPPRLNIWLSGGLCRPMLIEPVPGISTAEEWQRVAEAMAAPRTGLAEPCKVWVERRTAGKARMAAVVPESCLERLLACVPAGRGRARVRRIAPWWSEPLRVAAQGAGTTKALAVRDCDSLTVLLGDGKEFERATLYTPVLDDMAAQSTLTRVFMTSERAADDERVACLSLAAGSAGAAEPIALAPLTRWSP